MDNETLAFTPAVQVADMIRQKQLSPVELMTALLARIETLNPRVNAFAYLAADAAMDAAKHAEAALMRDERIGRLHGVPVTIKDLAITKDMPTQMGSHIFAGNQPNEDTPVVPRLRAEGFRTYWHQRVPPGDAAIALGQLAAVALQPGR